MKVGLEQAEAWQVCPHVINNHDNLTKPLKQDDTEVSQENDVVKVVGYLYKVIVDEYHYEHNFVVFFLWSGTRDHFNIKMLSYQ